MVDFSWLKRLGRGQINSTIADVLVNNPDGEKILGVIDYSANPDDLIKDIHKADNTEYSQSPIVKVTGKVHGLNTRGYSEDPSEACLNIAYHGFIGIGDFPVYFKAVKDICEVPNLKLEEAILHAGKTWPLTMTARLFKPRGAPYEMRPYVIRLGEYISPTPRAR